jgi:hypothetical protein
MGLAKGMVRIINLMRNSYYKIIAFLPTKCVLHIEHLRAYKRILNLKEPKYFGEKIQWLKFYGNLGEYFKYVDKYEVRKYVAQKVGEKYLNELIGVFNTAEEIDFSKLPCKFVIKATHGSKYNLICKDKKHLDIENAKLIMNKWLVEDYSKLKREPQYSKIKPKLICETLLEDENGELKNYRIFCFDGKPKFIQPDLVTDSIISWNIFDVKWNKMDFYTPGYSISNKEILKPENLGEMLDIAKRLSEDFPFVRVDLYSVKNRVLFGELTYTPESGSKPFLPIKRDLEIASWINLEKYLKTE